MNQMAYYSSNEEYITEMMEWVRQWIRLYRRYAVSVDEQGRLIQVKGSITFGNDLELSLEGQLSEEEKKEYEHEARDLRDRMKLFQEKAAASFQNGISIPLEYLFQVFHLPLPARFCVLLSVSAEYDRTMGRLFSLLQDDYKEKYPSLDLCLKIYTPYAEERFRHQAILLDRDCGFQTLMNVPLENSWGAVRIHPRILNFVSNFDRPDPELEGIASLRFKGTSEKVSEERKQLAQILSQKGSRNVCFINGAAGTGKRTMAGELAAEWKRPLLLVDIKALYDNKTRVDALLRSISRELTLRNAVCCGYGAEVLLPAQEDSQEIRRQKEQLFGRILNQFLGQNTCLFLTSERRWEGNWKWPQASRMDLEIPLPDTGEQIRLWEKLLSDLAETDMETKEVDPEALTVRFSLTPGQMIEALKEASDQCRASGKNVLNREQLYNACRRQLVMYLGDHVTQIRTQYQWDDLVLPERQKDALKRACDQVEYSHQVYDCWGFQRKIAYGTGVSMLFYGPPGTGKTMGAQVIANQLSMELYKVDLSSVMSKYIGETEKNLGKIFDEVKKSRSILFFDEADALFGKRTEVKDSHDKYANAETAYLLQKIEEYQGIVILATNYMQNFDEAFKRRIKFMIEFPFPLASYRLQMWRKVFPEEMPLEDLDYEYLAEQFELSGSSIKNIAVAAAFLAAAAGENVGMRQILLAVRDEMMKSGKSMPPENFGEYFGLIRDRY